MEIACNSIDNKVELHASRRICALAIAVTIGVALLPSHGGPSLVFSLSPARQSLCYSLKHQHITGKSCILLLIQFLKILNLKLILRGICWNCVIKVLTMHHYPVV